ncbi:MAG: hypothetical protein GVY36_18575 [Verrucomicrobia bacterium]|nr:hypothetical protein [Verrucomicrobiota bacterium]
MMLKWLPVRALIAIAVLVVIITLAKNAIANEDEARISISKDLSKEALGNHETLSLWLDIFNPFTEPLFEPDSKGWMINLKLHPVNMNVAVKGRANDQVDAGDALVATVKIPPNESRRFEVVLDDLLENHMNGEYHLKGAIEIDEFAFSPDRRGSLVIAIDKKVVISKPSRQNLEEYTDQCLTELEDQENRDIAIRKLCAIGTQRANEILASLVDEHTRTNELATIVEALCRDSDKKSQQLLLSLYDKISGGDAKFLIISNLGDYSDDPLLRKQAEKICIAASESSDALVNSSAKAWLSKHRKRSDDEAEADTEKE